MRNSFNNDTPEDILAHANMNRLWHWTSSSAKDRNATGVMQTGTKDYHWSYLYRNWYQRPVLYFNNI